MIIAPRGPDRVNDNPRGSWRWYEWKVSGQPLPGLRDTSVEKLGQLFDQLGPLTGVEVDPTQIYVGGFSQGAVMSLLLAATFPERLAGVLSHNGFISPESATQFRAGVFRGKPAFVAHGTLDMVLKVELGREIKQVLEEGGVAVTYKEYPLGHATSEESRRDLADWLNGLIGVGG